MEINIQHTSSAFQYTSGNDQAHLDICASEILTPRGKGFRPMELLLSALGGCLSIDLENILLKQRVVDPRFSMQIKGARREAIPQIFERIEVNLLVHSEIPQSKIEKAVALATEKYCSVYQILEKSTEIQINIQNPNP